MKKINAGFTLIELMIVVAIIGLLAALAIPNFIRFQARSKQSEAKANLKAIWTAQKSYYGDKNMYLDLADFIGFSPEFNNRYSYYLGGTGTETRATQGNPTIATKASTSCTSIVGVGIITSDEVKYQAASYFGAAVPAVAKHTVNTGGLAVAADAPEVLPAGGPGTGGCCPNGVCEFTAAAAGNVDNDLEWDNWSISSQGGAAGASVCSGGGTAASNYTLFAAGEPVNECNDVALK